MTETTIELTYSKGVPQRVDDGECQDGAYVVKQRPVGDVVPSIEDDRRQEEEEEAVGVQSVLLDTGCLCVVEGEAHDQSQDDEEAALGEVVWQFVVQVEACGIVCGNLMKCI